MATAMQAGALPSVHVVAEAVDQHYNRLRSLEAEFTEIYQGVVFSGWNPGSCG